MIRTWIADITSLLEKEKYLQYYKIVPGFRKEKADKIVYQEGKALSVGVWVLYEKMRRTYGLSKNAVFNLSHSGQYVLCSVVDSERQIWHLGCDIEGVKQVRLDVARRFFCASEFQRIVEQNTEAERAEEFYRYWVLKESFMKATRLGMKLGLDQFEIGFSKEGSPYLLKQPEEFPQRYYFKEYTIADIPYKIAVCSNCSEFSKTIEKIEL